MTPRRASAVEALLGSVVAYELWGPGDPDWLLDDERGLVTEAVPTRVEQFAAGRRCARLALAELEIDAGPILRSSARAPSWPDGVIGSITHTEGYALAVVGRPTDQLRSVGVDAERSGRVEDHLHRRLFGETEQAWLDSFDGDRRSEAATEMFGLKESFYKAQYPLTAAWVGFHDVAISRSDDHWLLEPATDASVLDAVRWPVEGRSLTRDSIVVTAVGVVTP